MPFLAELLAVLSHTSGRTTTEELLTDALDVIATGVTATQARLCRLGPDQHWSNIASSGPAKLRARRVNPSGSRAATENSAGAERSERVDPWWLAGSCLVSPMVAVKLSATTGAAGPDNGEDNRQDSREDNDIAGRQIALLGPESSPVLTLDWATDSSDRDLYDPELWIVLETALRLLGALVERAELQAALEYSQRHDALTGLLNRIVFEQELTARLDLLAKRRLPGLALIEIDVCDLRSINDERGYRAGDAVLGAIARRLDQQLRSGGVAGRIGEDTFGYLVSVPDLEGANTLAARLEAMVGVPILMRGPSISIELAIGGVFVADRRPLDVVLRAAERELSTVRRKLVGGRGTLAAL